MVGRLINEARAGLEDVLARTLRSHSSGTPLCGFTLKNFDIRLEQPEGDIFSIVFRAHYELQKKGAKRASASEGDQLDSDLLTNLGMVTEQYGYMGLDIYVFPFSTRTDGKVLVIDYGFKLTESVENLFPGYCVGTVDERKRVAIPAQFVSNKTKSNIRAMHFKDSGHVVFMPEEVYSQNAATISSMLGEQFGTEFAHFVYERLISQNRLSLCKVGFPAVEGEKNVEFFGKGVYLLLKYNGEHRG